MRDEIEELRRRAVPHLNQLIVDDLTDIARDPSRKDYVRKAANEVLAAVEEAKRLRTVNEVAVQSQGERRIGDWLALHGIDYRYDERLMIAKDTRIRPDFYLPEFDLYIEYWGMDTPEYVENMRRKRILYQQARKKLISISYRDFDRIELVLSEKLSKYMKL